MYKIILVGTCCSYLVYFILGTSLFLIGQNFTFSLLSQVVAGLLLTLLIIGVSRYVFSTMQVFYVLYVLILGLIPSFP